jgi:hypothetical protein
MPYEHSSVLTLNNNPNINVITRDFEFNLMTLVLCNRNFYSETPNSLGPCHYIYNPLGTEAAS